jgi:hypothetical protein
MGKQWYKILLLQKRQVKNNTTNTLFACIFVFVYNFNSYIRIKNSKQNVMLSFIQMTKHTKDI